METPVTPEPDFWESLEADANKTLEQQGVTSGQIITISTPTGQMVTVPVSGPTTIKDLINSQSLTLSPSATFVVDGAFVPADCLVAPGGHVIVSVPLKGG
jgi:sulfur carrier protein ThiS